MEVDCHEACASISERPSKTTPRSYLVLYNIMKHANFGYLMRTASAFGVCEIIVVGKRKFDVGGSCGQSRSVGKRRFATLEAACEYLRSQGCSICGVENVAQAIPINSQPFRGSTAFMVGNEGTGLSARQMSHCDYFVYVPQFGAAHCMNVNVATGITLHHFAVWAGFRESELTGQILPTALGRTGGPAYIGDATKADAPSPVTTQRTP